MAAVAEVYRTAGSQPLQKWRGVRRGRRRTLSWDFEKVISRPV